MAYTNVPSLIVTPRQWSAKVSGASVVPDGSTTTNIVQLIGGSADYAVGANGTRVDKIMVRHAPATAVANTAGILRVFLKAKGATFHLAWEVAATLVSRTATLPGFAAEWSRGDGLPIMILNYNGGTSDEVWVATEKADLYEFIGMGGDY